MSTKSQRDQLQQYINDHGISITAVARSIDYSGATLSQYLQGKYTGDVEKVDDAVKVFLELQHDRQAVPKHEIPYCHISTTRKLHEVARMCHLDGEIGVCYSDAGLGKTVATKRYAHGHKNVILIEADLGHTARVLFSELHRKCGLDGEGTIHDMFEDIIEKLKGSGRLIIIDEAEHLPYRALELLRRVYDKAGVGILLVGMPRLISNLRGKRGEYAQLYSRIGVAVKLDTLKAADTQEIVHAAIPGSNGVWKAYHEASGGNARILSKLIYRSRRVAQINKSDVTDEIVRETAKMLLI